MSKKFILSMLIALLFGSYAMADSGQTVTINGGTVDKVVTKITFNGDQVILHYSDNTTAEADMAQVVITLKADVSTGIGNVSTYSYPGIVGNTLNVGNIASGTPINIYNASGALLLQTKANGTSATINIESLGKGIYVLRAGNQVVKFTKR